MSTKTETLNDMYGDVIYAYTRKQAIADGEQVKVDSPITPKLAVMIKFDIYLTATVHDMIKKASFKNCNDYNGVLSDMLIDMCKYSQQSGRTRYFQTKITGLGRKKYHDFICHVGPRDIYEPELVATIMLPSEYYIDDGIFKHGTLNRG